MITPEDNIYLIDFGIARLFKPGKAQDTVAYISAGYAAPEQFGQAQTSPQSDIYSLGATLHQLLSGNKPSSNVPLFTFNLLKTYNPNIPTALASLILTMLNMEPTRRPKSMAVVRQELEHIQTVLKQPAVVPMPPTQYAPPPPPVIQGQYFSSPSISTPVSGQAAQMQRQVYQASSLQEVAKPALPKGIVWKTLLIGVVMAVYLFILVLITHYNFAIWLTTAILSLLIVGFITGKIVTLRRAAFFTGCITGLVMVVGTFFFVPTSNRIIYSITLVLVSGLICLVGGWLGTIGHPYYKKP
ncbi:MAG: protein kinase [Ktedonobacteraceae bacterium]|nr:protein kinase [Ktedonobacteraceae bacterium]